MSMNSLNTPCPFCGDREAQPLRQVHSPYNQRSYHLQHCHACDLQFFTPLVFEDVYATELVQEYATFHQGRTRWPSWTTAALKTLAKCQIPVEDRTILEIGAGDGVNFAALRAHYQILPENYLAVELDPKSVIQCRQRGITRILNATFNRQIVAQIPECFDLIFALEVLEHQINPQEFLTVAFTLLKRDGLLILTVPNRDRYFLRYTEFQGDLPPHHFLRFNARFFQKNFADQVYDLRAFPQKYKITNLRAAAQKLAGRLNLPPRLWWLCLPCLPLVKMVRDGMAYFRGEGLLIILKNDQRT
jgi:2-polyprenyl-3-methyl-5-hydroxy-6-metoxy-1,4-benzoquinol methylase